jgi:hypothetical protein
MDMLNSISTDKYVSRWTHGLVESSKKQYLYVTIGFYADLEKLKRKKIVEKRDV